jgi:hypothetical protein
MERALYVEPNIVSPWPIQRASAVLPFVRRRLHACHVFVCAHLSYTFSTLLYSVLVLIESVKSLTAE